MGTGSGNGISRADAYLAISRNLKSSTTGFSASDFVAISTNTCGTTLSKIPMTFDIDAVLEGGATYYFYWVTKSGEVYTTINERYYVVSASNMMSVNTVGNTTASSTSYAMPFSATMTIADSKYYRIKALYPDDICYLCSNSSNEDKIWKSTTAPSVTATRYIWKATLNSGLILQNVGSSRYIPKLTAGSQTGADVNYLTATTVENAEKFELQDNNPASLNKPGYIALKSTTTATDTWLNTATSGNAYVGMHNANNNKSGQFLFFQVKKVTFSTAVAINGGSAVSEIYVAVDGSDSFTLPEGYLYSVNGATEVSNTLAASAIAAAGTSNITVTVNAEAKNATARINNNRFYHIYTYNNGTSEGSTKYYLTSSGTLTNDEASAAAFLFTATNDNHYINAGYAWRITPDEGTYHFTNSESKKDQHLHLTSSNNRQNWEAQVLYWNGSKYAVRATNSTNGSGYNCEEFWTVTDVNSDGVPEADYDATTNTKHYVWGIEETGTVTYNLVFQGETLRTTYKKRADVLGEAVLPESSWNHECCAYSYSPTTITGETETVNVTMTWNVGDGLTFSSDYASATWYHVSVNNKWAKYDASVNGSQGHPLYADENEVNYDKVGYDGMWAFVGNPLDGAYVINRGAGDGQVLGWTTPPRMQGTSEGSSKMFIFKTFGDPVTGFTLHYSTHYINENEANKLVFLNSASGYTDDESKMTVKPISLYEQSLMELDDYAAEHAEGEYFGLKSSAVESLRTSIKTAKASYNSSAYDAAHDAIEALWPGTDNANVITPEAGNYRIKSSGECALGAAYIAYNSGKLETTTTDNLIETVVKLTGTYPDFTMSVQGQNVQNFTTYSQQVSATTSAGSTLTFSHVLTKPGYCTIKNETTDTKWPAYCYFHENGSNQVVSWESNATASYWKIEDVGDTDFAITLNSDGAGTPTYYATLYLPFDATITGADAFTLAKSGNYLVPTEVTDNEVPAGTPVLLKGTNATATATINDGASFNSGSPLSCALTGTYVDMPVEKTDGLSNDYYLGIKGSKVGFYKWDGTTLKANRAYLTKATAEAAVKGFILMFDDDDATGINTINGSELMVNGPIYNIAGQRLNKMQKGINIVNGKKVLK